MWVQRLCECFEHGQYYASPGRVLMVIWPYTNAAASERVCLQVEKRPGNWKCTTNLKGLGLMMLAPMGTCAE